ncbi:MAG TPA: ribosome biogenesis GTPase Der, partial [Bacteroidota bacterium]|nr:ribosome biogenesis GTPase Der [Bacteroidota bacterium]
YVPKSTDIFEKAIREQAEIAMEEADAIIFVVDALSGVTPLDRDIAGMLRSSPKKILLVANKVDGPAREGEAAQFFALGLGDPVPLSALGGRRIGDFLDDLVAAIGAEGPVPEEDEGMLKLAVVGKPNVGKSTLVNALLGKERNIVTDIPGTTRDSIDSMLTHEGEEFMLIDTAGLRRKSRIKESVEFYSAMRTLKTLERCNVAVQLVDAAGGMDKQDLHIVEEICTRRRGVILAVNKWDAVEKDTQTALAYEKAIGKMLRKYDYIPLIFISALKKQRIFKVVSLARSVHAQFRRRIATNKLNNVLLPEIERRPPSSASGREIRINYITQTRTGPPLFAFFSNDPLKIKTEYKRFLENRLRDHFGFKGVPVSMVFRKKNR